MGMHVYAGTYTHVYKYRCVSMGVYMHEYIRTHVCMHTHPHSRLPSSACSEGLEATLSQEPRAYLTTRWYF